MQISVIVASRLATVACAPYFLLFVRKTACAILSQTKKQTSRECVFAKPGASTIRLRPMSSHENAVLHRCTATAGAK